MSVLNPNSEEEAQECPLCLELLELDDISFYPCACGYQICRFCWNKIRTEGSGLCPACRSPYSENPADFKPLTAEELAKIKAEKRQKDQLRKQKISENRKYLANVRVVQKNLVFVVGLSPRLADSDVLRKPEYFGKFGKIHKVVINHSTSYAGNQSQGPSASAYVTYLKSEDALRAIQAVNNIFIDGRTLKASLGTTKYCSHFMKNQSCPKHDCMYLHELGDEAASFTKEEMQQGKHTDYERNLHDEITGSSGATGSTNATVNKIKEEKDSSPTESPCERNTKDRSDVTANEIENQLLEVKDADKEFEAESKESSESPLDLGEDDLGFDPFQETQKALAEMLETELQLTSNRSDPSSYHVDTGNFVDAGARASSPAFLYMNRGNPPHEMRNTIPPKQRPHPPPGFNIPRGNTDDGSRFGSGFTTEPWDRKEWEEGLRAILPNVNVSFGVPCSQLEFDQRHSQEQRYNNAECIKGQKFGWQLSTASNSNSELAMLDPAIQSIGGQKHKPEATPWFSDDTGKNSSDYRLQSPELPTNLIRPENGGNFFMETPSQRQSSLSWNNSDGSLRGSSMLNYNVDMPTPPPGFNQGIRDQASNGAGERERSFHTLSDSRRFNI